MRRGSLPGTGILVTALVILVGIFVLWRNANTPPPVVELSGIAGVNTQSPVMFSSPTVIFEPPTATFAPPSATPTTVVMSLTPAPPSATFAPPTVTQTWTPAPLNPTQTPVRATSTDVDFGILPPPVFAGDYPAEVNGIARDRFVILTDSARENTRAIYAYGQTLGRNPRAFSKLGDSTIENPHFLARFDGDFYDLGVYAGLQPVIDYYRGSFERQGMAVKRGMHAWTMFDPLWASAPCLPSEAPVECEIRLHNPSLVFIRLGTNDVGVPESFERHMRQIVEYCIAQGVIPVIGTKADRRDGPNSPNNVILRRLADEYAVPLWDFDLVAGTLPARGLTNDNAHMTTFYAHDYTQSQAFTRGHAVHNLTALMVLDVVWRVISG